MEVSTVVTNFIDVTSGANSPICSPLFAKIRDYICDRCLRGDHIVETVVDSWEEFEREVFAYDFRNTNNSPWFLENFRKKLKRSLSESFKFHH